MVLSLKNSREMPKVPVRVIINNHTISIFANKNYQSVFESFDLESTSASKESKGCFTIEDYKKIEKQQQLCVMQSNLQRNETVEQ